MANKGRLHGKVAIITGGASGMGEASARRFIEEGASVVIADIQDDRGQNLARELGANSVYKRTDVASESDVKAAVDEAVSRFGRLDIMVACAGVENTKQEVDTAVSEWDHVMDINARGVFLCSKHAIPAMKKNGGGSIINISSAYAMIGSQGYAAYHASKGAVRSFTKATAIAHALDGIRANSIHPGVIDTPMIRGIFAATADPVAAEAAYTAQGAVGRMGQPLDIAQGVVYLASDESSFVTGSELVIDGGILAR